MNNDDLVEIIGNTNEPAKILPYLGKIFAAITTLDIQSASGASITEVSAGSDENSAAGLIVTAMTSKEGESVRLIQPISLALGVKEWLIELEGKMCSTLASLLQQAYVSLPKDDSTLLEWIDKYPAQVIILTSQVAWTSVNEAILSKDGKEQLTQALSTLEQRLKSLSTSVLSSMEVSLRKKCEQLLTEMIHQRDVTRLLVSDNIAQASDFHWLYHLRFYLDPKEKSETHQLSIRMSNASFYYGFEYLGIGERLVQTPLTDRCYLTLTQALHFRMGGNPFGPAGTGNNLLLVN